MFVIESKKPLSQIDLKLLPSIRIENYIKTVGNPYIISENGNTIKLSFTGKGSLKQMLAKYFINKYIPNKDKPLQGEGANLV